MADQSINCPYGCPGLNMSVPGENLKKFNLYIKEVEGERLLWSANADAAVSVMCSPEDIKKLIVEKEPALDKDGELTQPNLVFYRPTKNGKKRVVMIENLKIIYKHARQSWKTKKIEKMEKPRWIES